MYHHPSYNFCGKWGLVLFDSSGRKGELVLPWIICIMLDICFNFSGPQVSWKVRDWIRSVFINILKIKPSWIKIKKTAPTPTPRPSLKVLLYFQLRIIGLHDLWCLSQLWKSDEQRFASHSVNRYSLLLLKAGKGPFQNSSSHAKSTSCLESCFVHGHHPRACSNCSILALPKWLSQNLHFTKASDSWAHHSLRNAADYTL